MIPILNLPRVDKNANVQKQLEQMQSQIWQLKEQIEMLLGSQSDQTTKDFAEVKTGLEDMVQSSVIQYGEFQSSLKQTASEFEVEVSKKLDSDDPEYAQLKITSNTISTAVFDKDGKSRIEQNAKAISAKVENDEAYSELVQTASSVKSAVFDEDGKSRIEQNAKAISAKVENDEAYSQLVQTANNVSSEVFDKDGKSRITQNAEAIEHKVENDEAYSQLVQTANSVSSAIFDAEGNSRITQLSDSVNIGVEKAYLQYDTGNYTVSHVGTGSPYGKSISARLNQIYLDVSNGDLWQYKISSGSYYWDLIGSAQPQSSTLGSQIKALAGQVVLRAYSDGSVAFIKLDGTGQLSNVKISGDLISLDGYTRVNGNFEIDNYGNLKLLGSAYEITTSANTRYNGALEISGPTITNKLILTDEGVYGISPFEGMGYLLIKGNYVAAEGYGEVIIGETNSEVQLNGQYMNIGNMDNESHIYLRGNVYIINGSSFEHVATQEWVEANFVKK